MIGKLLQKLFRKKTYYSKLSSEYYDWKAEWNNIILKKLNEIFPDHIIGCRHYYEKLYAYGEEIPKPEDFTRGTLVITVDRKDIKCKYDLNEGYLRHKYEYDMGFELIIDTITYEILAYLHNSGEKAMEIMNEKCKERLPKITI